MIYIKHGWKADFCFRNRCYINMEVAIGRDINYSTLMIVGRVSILGGGLVRHMEGVLRAFVWFCS